MNSNVSLAMNEPTAHAVIVIVDATFGERLATIPVGTPVWIIDSPANRAAAERVWAARPPYSGLEIIGTELTPALKARLAEYGLTEVAPRVGGFRVNRR